MTQEEKQLLLKDLCARLPYGVIVDYKENEFELPHWKINAIYPETFDGRIGYDKRVGTGSESGSRPFKIGEFKPYLRHMESMTEEEIDELKSLLPFHSGDMFVNDDEIIVFETNGEFSLSHRLFEEVINFYNSHHLDYRGLIPMGLALKAPEGMYKI